MNVYTSDGLLVSGGCDLVSLSAEQGQQLISIYRLFLQLHHAGTSTMRIKDMIKAETPDGASEQGSGVAGDKGTDRRGGGSARGSAGAASTNWSSIMPSAPETTAYTGSIAAVSIGIPYPIFLLSSNAIPATHRLRGFVSDTAAPQQRAALGGGAVITTTPATKNNNRSANGCEEIPLRWSLLTQRVSSSATLPTTSAAATGSVTGAPAATPISIPTLATANPTEEASPNIDSSVSANKTGVAGACLLSVSKTTSSVSVASTTAVTVSSASPSVPALCAYPSGWTAAELQVHSTKHVMVCTATELSLDLGGDFEDGNAPLLFCCTTRPVLA